MLKVSIWHFRKLWLALAIVHPCAGKHRPWIPKLAQIPALLSDPLGVGLGDHGAVCRVAYTILCAAFWLATPATAATQNFGPFAVDSANPEVISLNGEIDAGAALNFRRALQAAPSAKAVMLNSNGGLVAMGLLIADDVHGRKLSTFVPKGSVCYSACAYVFLAGIERKTEGELGVHQIASDSNDLVSAQMSISDIIDLLNRFGTPVQVLTQMFKTPPNQMYVFTPEEVEQFGINRTSASSVPAAPAPQLSDPPIAYADPAPTSPAVPILGDTSDTALSTVERYAKRPTRMAVFNGLDLFGDDVSSYRAADVTSCAQSCLSLTGQCKAFTFNADPSVVRGPNCFLKSSEGRADGNAVAISGKLLTNMEPDPTPFSMGTIDPKTALYDNVDLPGGDLFTYPHGGKTTAQQCRLACVANAQCIAFTHVKKKAECWLKGAIGAPRFSAGMTSGLKKTRTFSPATIISLE